ncbi:Cobalt-zinc-cadmium resistance protein CzcA [Minicystis rosea]|nr:Cobalt-zinc-cadmium resistance protein CzcA [Minicystis rosea]
MIDKLLELSIRARSLVILLSLIVVGLGLLAARRVPIDAVPDVTNVQVKVITSAPALGPTDVETYVTFPVEMAMAGLPKIEEIRSVSRAGISVVTVVFEEGMDVYFARQLVNERLTLARDDIPTGYGTPQLGPISSGLGEVYHFEVRGEGRSMMELRTILDWQISPRLRMVPGIVEVNTFGGEAQTLEVSLDPERLASAHLGVAEVIKAIEKNHAAAGGGWLPDGREHVTIRGEARVRSAADLGDIVVDRRDARTPVYVKDLGVVHMAPRVRYGAVTRDGRGEAVVGVAMMLLGANSGEVVEKVKETIADVQRTLPKGVTIDTYYDRTELVHRTTHTVATNMIEAIALVIAVLVLMLANLRAGSIVAMAIPLALVGVFIGMWATGTAGNLLSLGAIDFGLVVDGAIIIIENAQHRLAEQREHLGRPLTKEERDATVLSAAKEVRSATAFGEAIIALVYVPLLALEGVEGRMFRPMALTVLFALAAAFVLSLTLVPALASIALARDAKDAPSFIVRLAQRAYSPTLRGAVRRPLVPIAIAGAAVIASVFVVAGMGRAFLPKLDEGSVVVTVVRLPSASLDQSMEQTRQIETTLKQFPEVTTVVCRTGRAEIAIDPMGMNMTDVYVLLKPRSEWKTAGDREELVKAFDKALSANVPGAGWAFTQPIEMNTNDLLAGISSDLALHIYGDDLGMLKKVGERAVHLLKDIPGAADVRVEQIAGSSVLDVKVDRAAVARAGLDAEDVLKTVAALGGVEAGTIVEGMKRYPIQVRLDPKSRASVDAVAALPVRTPEGGVAPLGHLATVSVEPGPAQISRERLQRRTTVQLNVRGRDIGTFVQQAVKVLDKDLGLPTGYATAWAGEYERLQHAAARMAIIIPITLTIILVLLVTTFGRMGPALLILLNVPAAVTGGVAALALRGMELSISAAVGFIALFGVAVLNGLVLVSTIERRQASGEDLEVAVSEGSRSRVRPVLTTALVASLGFLPMALATGAGAEVQRPLATVIVGGILSSTLQTLVVLPAIYTLMARRRRKAEPPADAPAAEPPAAAA